MKITEKELKKIIAEESKKAYEAIRPNRRVEPLQPPSGLSWGDLSFLQGIHKHLATVAGGGNRAEVFAAVLQKMGVTLPSSAPSEDPAPDSHLEEDERNEAISLGKASSPHGPSRGRKERRPKRDPEEVAAMKKRGKELKQAEKDGNVEEDTVTAVDLKKMIVAEIDAMLTEGTSVWDLDWAQIEPELRSKPGLEDASEEELKTLADTFLSKGAWDEEDIIANAAKRYGTKWDDFGPYSEGHAKGVDDLAAVRTPRRSSSESSSWADDADFEQEKSNRKERERDRYWADAERDQRRRGY